MTNCQAEMVKLWNAIAPRYADAIKARMGRTFKFQQILTDEDNIVRVDFQARKRRGAMMGDKVSIGCQYDRGSDTYTLQLSTFNGQTFEAGLGAEMDGMTVDLVACNADAVVLTVGLP